MTLDQSLDDTFLVWISRLECPNLILSISPVSHAWTGSCLAYLCANTVTLETCNYHQSWSGLLHFSTFNLKVIKIKLNLLILNNKMDTLPRDLLKPIAEYLLWDVRNLVALSGTCKTWWQVINSQEFWKKLNFYYYFGREKIPNLSSKQNFVRNCKL